MKPETLYEIIGGVNEVYVSEAREFRAAAKRTSLKWCSAAACFALILMTASILIPRVLDEHEPISTYSTEALFEQRYCYSIDAGMFSSYVGGKVIDEQHIGDKIEDVTVTAGWMDSNQTWSDLETLRGEVYAIIGIPTETAAALRFIDQGEAITTMHYYVILNPDADLTPVEEYRIQPMIQNHPGDEIGEAVPE